MNKIIPLLCLCVLLVSCGTVTQTVVDPRITTCETVSLETQEKLATANIDPNIELQFLGTETILGETSACFLKVKISGAGQDSYNLFDLVREKTTSKHDSLEELDRQIDKIKLELSRVEVTAETQ